MRKAVLAREERALEMLVNLFDWLDSLKSQPTAEIVDLYDISQNTDHQPGSSSPRGSSVRGPKEAITVPNNILGAHVVFFFNYLLLFAVPGAETRKAALQVPVIELYSGWRYPSEEQKSEVVLPPSHSHRSSSFSSHYSVQRLYRPGRANK